MSVAHADTAHLTALNNGIDAPADGWALLAAVAPNDPSGLTV